MERAGEAEQKHLQLKTVCGILVILVHTDPGLQPYLPPGSLSRVGEGPVVLTGSCCTLCEIPSSQRLRRSRIALLKASRSWPVIPNLSLHFVAPDRRNSSNDLKSVQTPTLTTGSSHATHACRQPPVPSIRVLLKRILSGEGLLPRVELRAALPSVFGAMDFLDRLGSDCHR